MKLSALLAPLVAAKAPHETIMQVILAYEAEQTDALEKRRAADADRQARKRDREKSRDVTLRHSDRLLVRDRVAPVEDKLIPIDTNISKNTTSKDHSEFKQALASLDADQVGGLIKIRKAKKAPVTGYAASLFVKAAASCNLTVPEAADMCIERNWLTVKPEWMPSARGSPPPRPPSFADALATVATEAENRSDARYSSSDESPRGTVSYLPRVQSS